MNDIIVRYVDMPYCFKGYTLPDENGDYNVYINYNYPLETQQSTLYHELNHVDKDDFHSSEDIANIECYVR